MKGRRLALVTRRFWPLVGGAEIVMSNLATQFAREGADVRILTARWEPHWPAEVVHREVPVVRLPHPHQRGWGTLRYMLALARWLRRNQDRLDLVYVSMLKHDAYSAVGALRGTRVPVVLRAEGAGATGDCHWHRTARFGRRILRRCLLADAVVGPSPVIIDELRAAGFEHSRVHFIPNGVAVERVARETIEEGAEGKHEEGGGTAGLHDAERRAALEETRLAMAEANTDLQLPQGARLVVYTGRLHAGKGLFELIRAWRAVVARIPLARLWLIGEGPDRDELFETVLDQQVRASVMMPGAFDDVTDLLAAADLFVLPSYEEGMSLSLLEAMAAGVPVVATDIPGNRVLVTHQQHGLLVPRGDEQALATAIVKQLEQTRLARHYAQAARERVRAEYSLERTAQRHAELFDRLISGKRNR